MFYSFQFLVTVFLLLTVLNICLTMLIFVSMCISMVALKFHPTLSFHFATLDHALTCCHGCCCPATPGNHGPTELWVCPDHLFHKNIHVHRYVCIFTYKCKLRSILSNVEPKQTQDSSPSLMSLLSW